MWYWIVLVWRNFPALAPETWTMGMLRESGVSEVKVL